MKKFFYLVIFAVCISGCSSSTPDNVNIRTNVDISELNNPNVNMQSDSNSNKIPGIDTITDLQGNTVVIGNKTAATGKNALPVPNAKPLSYPAPDYSEVASKMNEQGQMLEVRTFKDNPTLAKIERLYVELNKPVVTAYLKNGKKVDLTSAKIENPMRSSAEEIINAINAVNSNPATKKQPS